MKTSDGYRLLGLALTSLAAIGCQPPRRYEIVLKDPAQTAIRVRPTFKDNSVFSSGFRQTGEGPLLFLEPSRSARVVHNGWAYRSKWPYPPGPAHLGLERTEGGATNIFYGTAEGYQLAIELIRFDGTVFFGSLFGRRPFPRGTAGVGLDGRGSTFHVIKRFQPELAGGDLWDRAGASRANPVLFDVSLSTPGENVARITRIEKRPIAAPVLGLVIALPLFAVGTLVAIPFEGKTTTERNVGYAVGIPVAAGAAVLSTLMIRLLVRPAETRVDVPVGQVFEPYSLEMP